MKNIFLIFCLSFSCFSIANDFDHIKKNAHAGNPQAQFDLGTMYDLGEGVSKDHKKAAEWYRKAAEQGEVAAQYNLAIMYDMGEGVEKDIVQAYAWIATAEMFGYHGAKESSKDFYRRMSKEEQDKGEALVIETVNRITTHKDALSKESAPLPPPANTEP